MPVSVYITYIFDIHFVVVELFSYCFIIITAIVMLINKNGFCDLRHKDFPEFSRFRPPNRYANKCDLAHSFFATKSFPMNKNAI